MAVHSRIRMAAFDGRQRCFGGGHEMAALCCGWSGEESSSLAVLTSKWVDSEAWAIITCDCDQLQNFFYCLWSRTWCSIIALCLALFLLSVPQICTPDPWYHIFKVILLVSLYFYSMFTLILALLLLLVSVLSPTVHINYFYPLFTLGAQILHGGEDSSLIGEDAYAFWKIFH